MRSMENVLYRQNIMKMNFVIIFRIMDQNSPWYVIVFAHQSLPGEESLCARIEQRAENIKQKIMLGSVYIVWSVSNRDHIELNKVHLDQTKYRSFHQHGILLVFSADHSYTAHGQETTWMDDSSLQHVRFYEQMPNSWLQTTAPTNERGNCHMSDKNTLNVIWTELQQHGLFY
jgi:hypothetical protein